MPDDRGDEPVILLTGFSPKPGTASGGTAKILRRLAASPPEGARIRTQLLPVDPEGALLKAVEAMDRSLPAAVIGLGGMAGGEALRVERLAINIDAEEKASPFEPADAIDAGGPAAYFSSLPVHVLSRPMREGGVPVEISMSPGTGLCNRLFYALLHYVELRGQETWFKRKPPAGLVSRIGFIRIPEPHAEGGSAGSSLDPETAFRGVALATGAVVAWLGKTSRA